MILCIVIALFESGFEQYKQLEPILRIVPKVLAQTDPTPSGGNSILYYIEIRNESKGRTIQHVKVCLDPKQARLKDDRGRPGFSQPLADFAALCCSH